MNPGSKEAIEKGCTCPVYDNHHGKGVLMNGEVVFWYSEDCKIHCLKENKCREK